MIKSINDFYIENFLFDYFSLNHIQEDTILDLGCGNQPYRKYYESHFSKIVTADIEDRSGKTDVIISSEILPFENMQFDTIILTEVIEHMPDPFLSIKEIARILKPGGTLLLTWPFNYPIHEIPNDHFRFTEFQMDRLLKNNSIKITKIIRRGNWLAILHTLGLQLGTNANEFIRRIPIIGRLLKPLCDLLDKLFELLSFLHFKCVRNFKTLNPPEIGIGLKGIAGSFAQWNLGYCVIAKKQFN
jgi:SAM-dependent methyltransferase